MLIASGAGPISGLSWFQLYRSVLHWGRRSALLSTDKPVASTPGRLELPLPDFVAGDVGPCIRLPDIEVVSVLLLTRGR